MDGEAGESVSVWQGERVRLRAVEPEDWPAFHAWNQDDEVGRAAEQVPFPESAAAVRRWTEEQALATPSHDRYRWVIEDRGGRAVGTINAHSCDRRHGTFSYGIAIGREHGHHGYASEAVRLVLRYFFEELGYQKANAHVYAFNEASIALHESLGFRREGCLRRMIFTRGAHHDTFAFGLTAEEFADGGGVAGGGVAGGGVAGGDEGRRRTPDARRQAAGGSSTEATVY